MCVCEQKVNRHRCYNVALSQLTILFSLAQTQGLTDKTVASFMKGRQRSDVILATKVSGYSERMTWMPRKEPDTPTSLTREQILYSVDESLKRLETDYIDLLQLHWPDRYTGGLLVSRTFHQHKLHVRVLHSRRHWVHYKIW